MKTKMTKNKKRFSKGALLATAALSAFLLGRPVRAEEIQKPKSEQKISIVVDYSTGTQEEGAKGQNSWAYFDRDFNYLYRYNNLPELNVSEKTQVQDMIEDVKYGDIDSYQDLVESSKSFSENQKVVLLAALANSLYEGSYDDTSPINEVFPQKTFFEQLQNYLATGGYSPLGVCRHIASHIEQLSNDLGLRANAVTGRYFEGTGHVYVILKREDGSGIIDGAYITISDTKNIEKMLEIYQKDKDSTVFEHFFFEDSKLKYRLVTKDGKNILDFMGCDESLNTLKKSLTDREDFNPRISLVLAKNDYSMSGKLNLFGLFAKIGQIKGNSSSPTKEMNLIQAGIEGKLSFPEVMDITPSLSVVYGDIIQQEHEDKGVTGASGSLMVNTNNEEGFNLSSRFAGKFLLTKNTSLFSNWSLEAGASYKIPIEEISLAPYVLGQGGMWQTDLGTGYFFPTFDEVNAGVILDIPFSSNTAISINPYYAYRNYEHELGIDAKVRTENISANAGMYVAKSVYDFAPDKLGIDAGLSASFENFVLKFIYKDEMKNYDGETSNNSSISLQGNIKF
ncbi:MAG: hypothetical protein NTU63_00290 [Candidatus Pacearchaeota archaeon]|nr:hypothetical protein [Candidatus Pacearchaeota archaeon]